MTERKFTGHVVSGRAVTTKDGLIAGINGSKSLSTDTSEEIYDDAVKASISELRISTELTDEQIEEFRKTLDQTGKIIIKEEPSNEN